MIDIFPELRAVISVTGVSQLQISRVGRRLVTVIRADGLLNPTGGLSVLGGLAIAVFLLVSCPLCSRADSREQTTLFVGVLSDGTVYTCNTLKELMTGQLGAEVVAARYHLSFPAMASEFPTSWKLNNGQLQILIASGGGQDGGSGTRRFEMASLAVRALVGFPGRRSLSAGRVVHDYFVPPAELMEVPAKPGKLLGVPVIGEGASRHSEEVLAVMYAMGLFNQVFDRLKEGERPFFFYDFVPTGDQGYTLFVLCDERLVPKGKVIDFPRPRTKNEGQGNSEEPTLTERGFPYDPRQFAGPVRPTLTIWRYERSKHQWSFVDRIAPSFREGFVGIEGRQNYFFVTESGGIFRLGKQEPQRRRLTPVWTKKEQAIVGVITDAATGKIYAFGQPRGTARARTEFYFEISEEPKPEAFDRSLIVPVKTIEPLKTVMEYSQFLAGAKGIKLP